MLADSLVYAIFAYALAFALAALTAGIIKVIQLATRGRQRPAEAGPGAGATQTEVNTTL